VQNEHDQCAGGQVKGVRFLGCGHIANYFRAERSLEERELMALYE
jgi:hypothetical protein